MKSVVRSFTRSACLSGLLHFVCAAVLTSGLFPLAFAATISNTASVSYTGPAGPVVQPSTTTILQSLPPPSPGVVTFYQYAPGVAGSVSLPFDGGEFDSGSGAFMPLPAPSALDGSPISLAGPVEIRPTTVYHANEPVFITLADTNRNVDAAVREIITVTVTTSTGDTEVLRLQETGPDTGVFAAVIQSVDATQAVTSHDGRLSVDINATLTVNYRDDFYPTDTSVTAALVDPFGVVFDSLTGAPVNGVTVTIIDASLPFSIVSAGIIGTPATVFGDDGVSRFPATVVTGSTVTDSSGFIYNLPPGGFRFPFVRPGSYRFVITPPAGYTAPSTVAAASLPTAPGGAPYSIVTGSYSDTFIVVPGPALNIDVPIDPMSAGLFMQKTVSRTDASAGDFLQYRLTLQNTDSVQIATAVSVLDRLPFGMRYQPGSLRLNGVLLPDPAVAGDSRTLTMAIGNLAPAATVQLTYVVMLGAGVLPGAAVNTAQATANAGAMASNTADVAVQIREPLFSGRFTIIGRVYEGDCNTPWDQLKGVANARLLMEDGTYVVTDKDGQYHIEAVRPGVHVVQLDVATLPAGLEPVSCIENTRFAGRNFSQFVDVKGGGLWRADFHTRARRAEVGIRLHSQLNVQAVAAPVAPAVPALAEPSPRAVKNYTVHAEFDSCQATLRPESAAAVASLIKDLSGEDIKRIELLGNTDNQRLSPRCQKQFKDNYALSEARAQTVGDALAVGLSLQAVQIVASGQGPDKPVVSNRSADGMARNRRTEIKVVLNEAAATPVQVKTDVVAPASVALTRVTGFSHRIEVDGGAGVDHLKVMAMLPADASYEAGSTRIDDKAAADPVVADSLLTFQLDEATTPGWTRVIEFSSRPAAAVPATSPVKLFSVRARFDSCSTVFGDEGKVALARLVAQLQGSKVSRIEVVGHTDNQGLTPRCQKLFKDNYALSQARAQAVAAALVRGLGLQPEQVTTSGRGADMPVASNDTAAGRASNSRMEVSVFESDAALPASVSSQSDKHQELFDSCSTELKAEGLAAVERLITEFKGRPVAWIELNGHSDKQRLSPRCQKQFKDNRALSQARAQVMGELIAKGLGLSAQQVVAKGRGADAPVADNLSVDGQARNRRTEVVVHLRDELPGTAPVTTTGQAADTAAANKRIRRGMADNRRADLIVYGQDEVAPAAAVDCRAGEHPVKALASFELEGQKRAQTPMVATRLSCAQEPSEAGAAAASLSDSSVRQAISVETGRVVPVSAELQAKQKARASISDEVAASGANTDWLEGQSAGVAWLFPGTGHNPRSPAVRIVIKHAPGQTVVLKQANGELVSALNYEGVMVSTDGLVATSMWRGVPLLDGDNAFVADIQDASGATVATLRHTVNYANSPVRAELVPEESILLADGIHRPVLAVRLLDRNGHPVRAGVSAPLEINAPYMAWEQVEQEQKRQLAGLDRFQPQYRVEGDRGIAYIELAPTSESGAVLLNLKFQTGPDSERRQELRAWLEPSLRDWVVVGFAEGTLGYNTLKDNIQPLKAAGVEEGEYSNGQMSLYAKGRVLGKWLLTMAYDSNKKDQRERQKSLLSTIDPNEFYTLYGDGTEQRYDAASQDNLYLKMERGQFYALFGDYETGLSQTQLSRYSRTLNGIKTENGDGLVTFIAFAAETPQNAARDEIQGDGTSGLYRLSQNNIVLNSERIRIETRDRLHSQNIVQTRTLARHLDYDIDYSAGTIFFRQPVNSRDTSFNPTFIVAEYETVDVAENQLNAGGRVALNLQEGRAVVGVSAVRDENSLGQSDLAGMDLKLKLASDSELRVEAAQTQGRQGLLSPQGEAWLAELEHHSGKFDLLLYARRQDGGFGLSQQNASEGGQQKIGADTQIRLTENWSLQGQVYDQENLVSAATRDAVQGRVQYKTDKGSVELGAQSVLDQATTGALAGQDFRSDQASIGASRYFFNRKLELNAQAETALGGKNESIDFPDRYVLGAGLAVTDNARLLVGQEFTDGDSLDSSTTRVGVQVVPWKGARLDSTLNQSRISEYGPRTFGQMGLTQAVLLDERWGLDFSVDSSHTFNEAATPAVVVNPAHPVTSGGTLGSTGLTEDFSAFSAGATYRAELWSWNGRAETRNGETTDRYGLTSSFLRQAEAGVAFSTSARVFRTEQASGTDGLLASLDLSWAWRPLGVQWSLLDRLEFRYDEVENGTGVIGSGVFGNTSLVTTGNASTRRIINNLALNRVSREWTGADRRGNLFNRYERNQWSFYYGSKYALDTFDGVDYSGYTDLLGLEVRHDIKPWLDIGVQASSLNAWSAGTHAYSLGPMIGASPVTNGWITLGYNYRGFTDQDFDAARYTAQGPYLQLRFKFDQNTRLGSRASTVSANDSTNTRASE